MALAATFLINVDTTIVNVAIPTLSRELRASTSDLQWVVDAYNLAFAALILTGGTISDRYGRRRTLIGGLVLFAGASAVAATVSGVDALIALARGHGRRGRLHLPDHIVDHQRRLSGPGRPR